jgi:protein-S-isoprenylcysteine O-methyltransferase Ste14
MQRGDRGEVWVVGQFVLLGVLLIVPRVGPKWSRWLAWVGRLVGVPVLGGGVAMMRAAFRDLGPNLTPLPKPKDDSRLVRDGLYAIVRHPIYSGVILFAYGIAALTGSTSRLAVATALLAWLNAKASREEAWLLERYPDYADYRREVPKLLPWPR